jgi:hypothetical protein
VNRIERQIWDLRAGWLAPEPSSAALDLLESNADAPEMEGLIRFLAPKLMRRGRPALLSPALQSMARSVEGEQLQRQAALRATALLDQAKIRHLYMKGGDFRYRLYGDPATRASNDIDLLFAPSQVEAATRTLMDAGAAPVDDPEPFLQGRAQELSVRLEGATLDLHRSMVQLGRGEIPFEELFERSERLELDDRSLPVPERNDAFALCLIHIGRHEGGAEFVKFHHGLDVLLAVTGWELDFVEIGKRVRRWRCSKLAGAGLWVWKEAFGTDVPAEAWRELDPGAGVRTIAPWSRRLLRRPEAPPRPVERAMQLGLKWAFAEDGADRGWLLRELFRRRRVPRADSSDS